MGSARQYILSTYVFPFIFLPFHSSLLLILNVRVLLLPVSCYDELVCGENMIRDTQWWAFITYPGLNEPCYECPMGRVTDPSDPIHDTWSKCQVCMYACMPQRAFTPYNNVLIVCHFRDIIGLKVCTRFDLFTGCPTCGCFISWCRSAR
jgi:hypothetical protein